MHDLILPMPDTSLLPAESMDCPAPLAWQDVVASWREESEPFETDGCHGPVRGRTLGRGPALYFANPLLGRCELFALLAWLLRDEFRCVLFDDSTLQNPRTPRLRGSVVDMVDDLLAVAAFHQDSRFSVVGSGLGSGLGSLPGIAGSLLAAFRNFGQPAGSLPAACRQPAGASCRNLPGSCRDSDRVKV